jgi:DNA-binding transcriptional MerR regulator
MSASSRNTTHGITAVARAAGVSTRTLRHYGDIGLLPATETGAGGLRRYDDAALVRLQRILLLRSLGLGLADVRRMLDGELDDVAALTEHLTWLERERDRIDRQLAAVRTTIGRLQEGRPMDTTTTFDGFDDSDRYREEVEERWGRSARERGTDWWASMSDDDRRAFRDEQRSIAIDAAAVAVSPSAAGSEALALRQLAWLRRSTPGIDAERFVALADMYVDDERFAGAYDSAGPGAARALRDAMRALADAGLPPA